MREETDDRTAWPWATCGWPRCCTTSSPTRRCPAPASTPTASGPVWTRSSPTSPRGTRTCWPAATSCRPRSTSGTGSASSAASTPASTSSSSPRSATCCPSRRTSPSPRRTSTPRSPPPPARSWWCRSSTPASRSTPPTPAGVRCTTRSTAPTSSARTDGAEKGGGYNKVRGDKVIAYARDFLDEAVPLASGSLRATPPAFLVVDGAAGGRPGRRRRRPAWPARSSSSATSASRARPTGRCCWSTTACTSRSRSTRTPPIGTTDAAGVKDVVLESAITTIMDFEDSVAAVDADDKVLGYRNWLGLNRGDLAEEVSKGGKTFTRVLNADRTYTAAGRRSELHPARPQPAVRPQRRSPDDQRRDRRRATATRSPRASRTPCSPA